MASYRIITKLGNETLEPYRNMILSRWMNSLRFGNDLYKLIDSRPYYDAYQRLISSILRSSEVVVRIAVLTDDEDVALGFSVFRGAILDYVHVHKDQRRQGIASHLVPPYIDTFTHITRTGMLIWNNKVPDWKFNPFA